MARSQGYFQCNVTGGTVSGSGGGQITRTTNGNNSGTYAAGANGTGANCSGTVTYTFTWIPSYPGEPAPGSVVIAETSTATWAGPPGACANGLGDSEVDTVVNGVAINGKSTGTFRKVDFASNGSFTETIAATANSMGTCQVSESVLATPVELVFVSGIMTVNLHPTGLVGVHETVEPSAPGYTLSAFHYGIDGPNAYKASVFGSNFSSHSWVQLQGSDFTTPTFSYSCGSSGEATPSCMCSVSYDGTVIGQVLCYDPIFISVPLFDFRAIVDGLVGYAPSTPATDGSGYFENPAAITSNTLGGIGAADFQGYVQEPTWLAESFGDGQFNTCQIVSVLAQYTYANGNTLPIAGSGLDGKYPYALDPWQRATVSNNPPAAYNFLAYDTPGFGLGDSVVNLQAEMSFEHFLIFNGGGDDIPLKGVYWDWNASAAFFGTIGSINYWNSPSSNPFGNGVDVSPFNNFVWSEDVNPVQP